MSLDHLAGLRGVKRLLPRLSAMGSGVHAVLLYGSAGCGKSTVADVLAKAWLCREPTPEGACGACRPCEAFGRGTSADFQRIEPQGPSRIIRLASIVPNTEEGSSIPVQSFFRTPPLMARHRVVVIEDADRMNAPAANALLKTLEEPHAHARLILTTSAIGAILPTILSRCVAVACELPDDEGFRAAFGDLTEAERVLSEGVPGALLEAREDPATAEGLLQLAKELETAPPGAALLLSERLRSLCEAIQDRKKIGPRLANAEGLERFGACVRTLHPRRPGWARAIAEAHRRILGNGHAGLVFDALFADTAGNARP